MRATLLRTCDEWIVVAVEPGHELGFPDADRKVVAL